MAAISKDQLMKHLTAQDLAQYAVAEASINDQLKKSYSTGGEVWCSVGGLNRRVIDKLIEAFRAAGWAVQYHTAVDQRDENSIVLK